MEGNLLPISYMLISTSAMNIGMVIQKRGMDTVPPVESQSILQNVRNVLTNRHWVSGFLLCLFAMVMNFLALSRGDLSVVQPLIAFGLVVVVVFSRFYLGERVTRREGVGVSLAVIGVIIVGSTATAGRSYADLDEVAACYLEGDTLVLLLLVYTTIGSIWMSASRTRYRNSGVKLALVAALFSVTGFAFSKGFSSGLQMPGVGLVGLVTSLKAWVLFAVFGVNSIMALVSQQISFQKGRAVVVSPVFNILSIVLPVVFGAIIFDEWARKAPREIAWQLIAMAIIVAGAVMLSMRQQYVPAAERK